MKNHKISKRILSLYILSFLLPVFAALVGLLAGSFAPFGEKNIMSAGAFSRYLPYYYEMYDRFRGGQGLGYSIMSGLGYDFTGTFFYYLSDPTNLFILLFPREDILAVINILYVIKVGFTGLFLSIYLVYRKEHVGSIFTNKDYSKPENNKKDNLVIGLKKESDISIIRYIQKFEWMILAISVVYSASMSIATIGMNVTYLSAIAILPLIIMGIDKVRNGESIVCLSVSLILSFVFNIHISIISFIFILIYLFICNYENVESFVYTFSRFLISLFIAVLSTSFVWINACVGGVYSNEIGLKVPHIEFGNPINIFRQLLSGNSIARTTIYGAGIDVAIGMLLIFGVILFACSGSIKLSYRIKNSLCFLFLLATICCNTTRYIFNGFSNQSEYTIVHYSYIIVFFAAILTFDVLQKVEGLRTRSVIISFVVSCAVLALSIFKSDGYDNVNPFIVSLEFLFGYFLISLIYTSKSLTKRLFVILISVLSLVEIVPSFTKTITAAGKSFESQKIINISEVLTYETERYIHSINPNARILKYNSLNATSTAFTNMIIGYDYLISDMNTSEVDALLDAPSEYRMSDNSIQYMHIFKNPLSTDGVLYSDYIDRFKYEASFPFNSANRFCKEEFLIDDIFESVDFDIEGSASSDNSMAIFNVSFDDEDSTDYYFRAYSVNYYGQMTEEGKSFYQAVPNDPNESFSYQGVKLNENCFKDVYNTIISDRWKDVSGLSEAFTVDNNGYAYLSVRYSNIKTLSFYVNGKKVTPISILDNNSLLPLENGANEIVIKYNYSYLILSIILSFIGLLIFFGVYLKSGEVSKSEKAIAPCLEKGVKKASAFIRDNYVYIAVVFICTAVFVLSQMVAQCYPFGDYTTSKNDGLIQRYSMWLYNISSMREDRALSFVDYDIGGYFDSFFNLFAYRFLTPWTYLRDLIIPENMYLFVFTVEEYLYYVLSGATIIFYLTHRHKKRMSKTDARLIVLGSLYALSSYSILFYAYSAGFRYMPYIPLIILGLEQLVYKKKAVLYVSILFLQMLFEPYPAFLLCEFIVLVFLTFDFNSVSDFLRKGVRFGFYSVIAALLSSFVLVTYLSNLVYSSYTLSSEEGGPSISNWFASYINTITDYHTAYPLGIVTDDPSKAGTYIGLIILFIIPLYILNKKIKKSDKIRNIIIIALFFFAVNNEFVNYVFHGFHMQSMVPNRFAAFIVFFMICRLADILDGDYNHRLSGAVVLISSVIMGALYCYRFDRIGITVGISLGILSVYIVLGIYAIIRKTSIEKAILVIAILDILANGMIQFPNNIGSFSGVLTLSETINEITDVEPDIKQFYNLTEYIDEETHTSNLGLSSSINTVRSFFAAYTMESYIHDAFFNISVGKNIIYYYGGNPLADMMLHVKYHITDDNNPSSDSIYPELFNYNNYTVHKNPYYISMGFVISSDEAKEFTRDNSDIYVNEHHVRDKYGDSFAYQNALSHSIGGSDLYTIIPLDSEEDNSGDNDCYFSLGDTFEMELSNKSMQTYIPIYFHLSKDYIGKRIYMDNDEAVYYLGEISSTNELLYIEYPIEEDLTDDFKPVIACFNEASFTDLYTSLSDDKLENLSEDGRNIYADLNSSKSGMLYISLPYDDGWKAYVDGTEVEIERYLGSMGVPVEAGEHDIQLSYFPRGAFAGIGLSLGTLILIILFSIFRYVKSQKAKTE